MRENQTTIENNNSVDFGFLTQFFLPSFKERDQFYQITKKTAQFLYL